MLAKFIPGRLIRLFCGVFCLIAGFQAVVAQQPSSPAILNAGYPRAFFFRGSESTAARGIPYARWDRAFSALDGIMGKTLDEEVPGRSTNNINYFSRFKVAHPEQVVLLHFNGKARDPRYQTETYFAGHWLYFNGCRVLDPLPAAGGEVVVHVQNPRLFKVNTGRYQSSNEDLALCALGAGGKPDWTRCEQVQLVAIDIPGKTITIRRGAFGSKPLAFAAKRSYVAAHSSEGPWGKGSNMLWDYNLSSTCPRDAQGRTCADVLVGELKDWLGPRGPLASFDGLEFDVSLFDRSGSGRGLRGLDADGDGVRDDGVIGGLNVYGLGQTQFHTALRAALGEGRIIQADGASGRHQRSFGILNGIESEGFPDLNDKEIIDWSGGLNRHFAWRANARLPVFNYINHKFVEKGGERHPEVPFNIHRLVFAAAMFTDSVLTFAFNPPAVPGDLAPVWDEMVNGEARQRHWLGRPMGEVRRLGLRTPDLLGGAGARMDDGFAKQWESGNATVEAVGGGEVRLRGTRAENGVLSATLAGVSVPEGDLLVYFTIRGEARAGYPPRVPRLAWLACETPGKAPSPLTPARIMTWVTDQKFLAGFYFRDVGPAAVKLTLQVEGTEPVYVSGMTIHNAPDAMARLYEHGLVLANPGTRPYTFDVRELGGAGAGAGVRFRRIQGTALQDPKTNNGAVVGETVTLGPRDALFLVRSTLANR